MQERRIKSALLLAVALFTLCILIPGIVMGGPGTAGDTNQAGCFAQLDDGYDNLPLGYKLLSYSSLVREGLVIHLIFRHRQPKTFHIMKTPR
jgi:hypothetical protein